VLGITSGFAHAVWRAARAAYLLGSSCGGQTSLYSRLRHATDYNTPGPLLQAAGRPLQKHFAGRQAPLVVAHPILVSLLREHAHLIYQHGEVVVPFECLVDGRHTILVPTSEVAQVFLNAGADADNVVVTGLCIEPQLAESAAALQAERQQRLATSDFLTGGFFSSGAEPAAHVDSLVSAALSTVLHGGSAIFFARRGGSFARKASRAFRRRGLTLSTETTQVPPAGALLLTYEDRPSLDAVTRAHFDVLDYFVAPSHERSNWAVGLGLPMFIVDPPIGTFAPRNREFLLAHGVAEPLPANAGSFGARLNQLQSDGILAERSNTGWGRYPIDGFRCIAETLG